MHYITDEATRAALGERLRGLRDLERQRWDLEEEATRIAYRLGELDADKAEAYRRLTELTGHIRSPAQFHGHQEDVTERHRRLAEIDAEMTALFRRRAECRERLRSLKGRIQSERHAFWQSYGDALLMEYREAAESLALRYLHPLRLMGASGHGLARLTAGAVEALGWWEQGGGRRRVWPALACKSLDGKSVEDEELKEAMLADVSDEGGA